MNERYPLGNPWHAVILGFLMLLAVFSWSFFIYSVLK